MTNKMIKSLSHFRIELPEFREIIVRHINVGDIGPILRVYCDGALNDKETVAKILHHQVITPKLQEEDVLVYPRRVIKQWATEFATKDRSLSGHFKSGGDSISRFLLAVERFQAELNEQMRSISDSARATLGNINLVFQNFALLKTFAQQNKVWVEQAQRFAESMLPSILEHKRLTEQFQKSWFVSDRKYKADLKTIKPYLMKYKWLISPSMPAANVDLLADAVRERKVSAKEFNALFLDYFTKDNWTNTEEMVTDWKPGSISSARLRILRHCIQVLQADPKGKYNPCYAVLPALIAQIDGVVTDYLESKGVVFKSSFRKSKATPKGAPKRKDALRQALAKGPYDDGAEPGRYLLLDILFQTAYMGVPLSIAFNFNRHKIMHGENLNYGRKDYVARCILILDFLAHL